MYQHIIWFIKITYSVFFAISICMQNSWPCLLEPGKTLYLALTVKNPKRPKTCTGSITKQIPMIQQSIHMDSIENYVNLILDLNIKWNINKTETTNVVRSISCEKIALTIIILFLMKICMNTKFYMMAIFFNMQRLNGRHK